jgi:hypothetical protein
MGELLSGLLGPLLVILIVMPVLVACLIWLPHVVDRRVHRHYLRVAKEAGFSPKRALKYADERLREFREFHKYLYFQRAGDALSILLPCVPTKRRRTKATPEVCSPSLVADSSGPDP